MRAQVTAFRLRPLDAGPYTDCEPRCPSAAARGRATVASVLRRPLRGAVHVKAVMDAVAGYYAHLDFTQRTTDGTRTYLEWVAAGPTGTSMNGITVLVRGDDGLVTYVAIHHRPFDVVREFSREIGRRTVRSVPAGSFDD